MKILFFTHYAQLYGANRSLLNLIAGLANYGVESVVFCPEEGPFTQHLSQENIAWKVAPFATEVYYLRGLSRLKGLQRHLYNRLHFGKIVDMIRAEAPDLLYSNTSALHVGAKAAYRLGIPHIWHIREMGEADYRQRFNLGRQDFLKRLHRSAAVVAISQAVRQQGIGDFTGKVDVVYNGVISLAQWQQLTAQAPELPVTFCLVGAIQPEKGQQVALAAFARLYREHPDTRLLFAGDSPTGFDQQLKQAVAAQQLGQAVSFLGFVADPFSVYQQSHVALMCSPNEGMGRVTVEAMAAGLPVIGYQGGGTLELIDEGQDGLFFRTEEALYQQMKTLLRNPALRQQMGQAARQKVRERFTQEHYSAAIWEVIRRVKS